MPTKSGSNRIGWNQRGPTNAQLLQRAKEESNHDSALWEQRTWRIVEALKTQMTDIGFALWANRVFPGASIDEATWKQIHDLYKHKLDNVLAGGDDCTCSELPNRETTCESCIEQARKMNPSIPF